METNNNQSEETKKEEPIELPHKVALERPIPQGEVTIREVVFKNELVGSMVAHFPTGGTEYLRMEHFYPIISKMTGETTHTVNNMGYKDLQKCIKVVSHFLTDGQETQAGE